MKYGKAGFLSWNYEKSLLWQFYIFKNGSFRGEKKIKNSSESL